MFKIHRTLMAAALLVAATSSSQAAFVNGQLAFSFNTTITVSPLLGNGDFGAAPYTITGATGGTVSTVSGDYGPAAGAVISAVGPFNTSTGPFPYLFQVGTGVPGSFGTFTGSSVSIAVANATTIQLVLAGTFSKNGDTDKTPTTLTMTFQRSLNGSLVSGSGTLVSAIPEPSSIALAGIGLAAAGLFGLRKRLAK